MSFIQKPLQSIVDWMATSQKKMVYELYEGSSSDWALLSPKFANLCDLHRHGIRTPPAFILTTDAARDYAKNGKTVTEGLIKEYSHHVIELERQTGKVFGSKQSACPLLLCARVGAPMIYNKVSASMESVLTEPLNDKFQQMNSDGQVLDIFGIFGAPESWCCPGVMETVVSIGLNDSVVYHLASVTSKRFALHTYAHFLFRFSCIVLKASPTSYHRVLYEIANRTGRSNSEMNDEDLASVIQEFKKIQAVPEDPWEQLRLTITAVYRAWFDDTARLIREKTLLLSENVYPTVCLQANAYGGLAVLFTRNPSTGVKGVFGDYWPLTGGKVSITEMIGQDWKRAEELNLIANSLEEHFRDMLDVELIVEESGQILVLQVRSGRRSAVASMRIAVDMAHEKTLTEREALMRIDISKCRYFVLPQVETDEGMTEEDEISTIIGVAASHGAVSGVLAFTSEECLRLALNNDVIYCFDGSRQSQLEDYMACKAAAGVITLGGTILSNIAVICRNLMKPCIVGVNAKLHIHEGANDEFSAKRQISSGIILSTGEVVHEGKCVTVDGSTGTLHLGQVRLTTSKKNPNYLIILKWADKFRRVRVEATIPSTSNFLEDIRYADDMGADGFCVNTDQLLSYTKDRLTLTRLILFSQSEKERQIHLNVLTELQRDDFKSILRASQGKPMCIKLLDKSLHHLMPTDSNAAFQIAISMNRSLAEVKRVMENVNNQNPAFGLRGCRIAALYPFFTVMQIRALVMAMLDLAGEATFKEPVRIAIPMINSDHEFDDILELIKRTVGEVLAQSNKSIGNIDISELFAFGAILSSPRACMRSATIAVKADFMYLNLEDLTATSFSSSKDDADKFLPLYLKDSLLHSNPFKTIDEEGVGLLAQSVLKECQRTEKQIQCGVVEGDQTGDPESVKYLCESGFSLISCAPSDVSMVRIAAAKSHIHTTTTVGMKKPFMSFLPHQLSNPHVGKDLHVGKDHHMLKDQVLPKSLDSKISADLKSEVGF